MENENREWKEVRLGDFVKYNSNKIEMEEINKNNYISTENMLENFGGIAKSSNLPNIDRVLEFRKNDILFSNIRTYFKKLWFANFGGGCSNDVLVFRKNNDEVYEKYIYYCLMDNKFIDYTVATSKGTKMPRGDKSAIMNYVINLPPLPEQKRIAETLSSLDEKIELNNQMNKTLEEMAQALFKQWFVDFEFPNENGEPYKSSGGEMEESELGMIPKGWRIVKFSETFEVTDYVANGSFASLSENVQYKNEPDYAILIRLTDYNRGFKGDFIYVNEHSYNFLSKSKLNGDEIIIANVGANAGDVFRAPFLNRPMTLGPNAIMIKNNNVSNYLYLFLISSIGQHSLKSIIAGSAQPKFNKTDFRKLKFILPDENILYLFNDIYKSINEKLLSNKSQIQALTQIRDTLLPKLMSGEI